MVGRCHRELIRGGTPLEEYKTFGRMNRNAFLGAMLNLEFSMAGFRFFFEVAPPEVSGLVRGFRAAGDIIAQRSFLFLVSCLLSKVSRAWPS